MTETDLYELLGVGRDATDDELKRAYRAKARAHHPDTNQDDSDSGEHFKEIGLAYEVLSDPERRARYDRYGHAGVFGAAAGGNQGGARGTRRLHHQGQHHRRHHQSIADETGFQCAAGFRFRLAGR